MDVSTIKAAWDHYLLIGSGVAYAGVSLFAAGYMLVCAYRGMCGMAKRIGWASVVVLLSFFVWATITGTPTQEDKEDAIEQEQGEAQTNAMFGAMWFGGGLRTNVGGLGFGIGAGNSSEPEGAGDQLSDPVVENESAPMVRSLTDSDYAAGFALSRIGTGETFDFSAPQGSTVCEDWQAFGASRDWFRLGNGERGTGNGEWGFAFPFGTNTVDALTVFSNGSLRPRMKCRDTFISPFETTLCVVPSENWHLLSTNSAFCMPNSQFWHYHTPTNTLVMTWQNVLLDQLVEKPVSFQTEFFENGDIAFRYDLSRLADTTVSDLVVGIRNAGYGRVFTQLDRNVTSLYWRRLDPLRAGETDPDDDGITTDDEVLVYHTDPYSADSDRDGLSDGLEIGETHTDPLDAHALRTDMPDGMASVIGDLDPFSCPDGSTNTVWEHVFYTGTTNAPFAYPSPSGSTAVLEVTASGTGSGELIVGDKVVPLLPRPRLLMGVNGASDPTAMTLRVPVFKGTVQRCFLRIPESLEVAITASDFVYGERPTFLHPRGWFAFPNTEASYPCIHDLGSRRVAVSLDPGFAAPGLSCVWNSTASVGAVSTGDLSATLFGHFSPSSTAPVTYTLSHPRYICGRTVYTQTARFCPRIDDDDLPEAEGRRIDEEYGDEDWRCDCGNCEDTWCPCSCHDYYRLVSDDDECPVHWCPWECCEWLHSSEYAYDRSLPPYPDVLNFDRVPPDTDEIYIDVPEGFTYCCPCPEHWTNKVSLAYKSYNLAVRDEAGGKFTEATRDCSVFVCGLSPSRAVGDSTLAFCKTGVVYETRNYTVLGMRIEPCRTDRDALLRENPGFGLPFVAGGDGVELELKTDVLLSDGNVHLAIVNATTHMRLVFDVYGGEELLLDSETRPSVDIPVACWRNMIGQRFFDVRTSPVCLYADAPGTAELEFGFAKEEAGHSISAFDSLPVTAVAPPLLPDYDRDGVIGAQDVTNWMNGAVFRYWTNQDAENGDCVDEISNDAANAANLSVDGRLDLVNLFPLALNFRPFVEAWGSRASFELWTYVGGESLHICFADVPWSEAGSIQTNDVRVTDDALVAYADLEAVPYNGYMLPYGTIRRFSEGSGLLIAEAVSPVNEGIYLTIRLGDEPVIQHRIKTRIRPVREMYNWINVRHLSDETENRSTWCSAQSCGSGKTLVFLHGANVAEPDAEKWGDTIFKRLWLTGCNIDFYNVDWRSDIGLSANYHQNASNAFEVAARLAPIVTAIPGEKTIMAHSLGNMVVSSMIQDYGLQVSKYLMCDSAVPSEAYCGQDDISIRVPQLLHPDWESYPTNTWASNWHKHFREIPDDDRKHLGWPARFSNVPAVAVNFYSTGDEVLELNVDNDVDILSGVRAGLKHLSWHKQEMFKGRSWFGELLGSTYWSGWGFNVDSYTALGTLVPITVNHYSPEQAADLSSAQIRSVPVFNPYPASITNAPSMSLLVRAAHLTQGIPALAPPTGGCSVRAVFSGSRSFNLNLDADEDEENEENGIPKPNGWPIRAKFLGQWLHSDMKDVAFYYNYKFYEKAAEKGGLK